MYVCTYVRVCLCLCMCVCGGGGGGGGAEGTRGGSVRWTNIKQLLLPAEGVYRFHPCRTWPAWTSCGWPPSASQGGSQTAACGRCRREAGWASGRWPPADSRWQNKPWYHSMTTSEQQTHRKRTEETFQDRMGWKLAWLGRGSSCYRCKDYYGKGQSFCPSRTETMARAGSSYCCCKDHYLAGKGHSFCPSRTETIFFMETD